MHPAPKACFDPKLPETYYFMDRDGVVHSHLSYQSSEDAVVILQHILDVLGDIKELLADRV